LEISPPLQRAQTTPTLNFLCVRTRNTGIDERHAASFAIFVFAHSPTREPNAAQGLNLLWNRLATPQDTHDQESNAPSAPLAKCTRFGCAQIEKTNNNLLAGESPERNCSVLLKR